MRALKLDTYADFEVSVGSWYADIAPIWFVLFLCVLPCAFLKHLLRLKRL